MNSAKEKLKVIYDKVDDKFFEQFKFRIKDTSCMKIVDYLHAPKDSSSLAVTRILFGLSMLFDIPDERGGAIMADRWGNPKLCHFPLAPFIRAIPMPYMALVYAALWMGAVGIMLGYKFRMSAPIFATCYWYLFLIEKSYWNNHSYLFGLVGLLLCFTNAHCYWSLDAYLNPNLKKTTVPYWNYFILKYQFFILYFMAGVKKGTAEWLAGYSMMNLSSHWVFTPFRLFLSVPQIDYLIVHWFIFAFDLTIAFWMMWGRTRNVAMIFCATFHLMNSRLFRIGMFPWVCLATMPLFYPFHWPKTIVPFLKIQYLNIKKTISNIVSSYKQSIVCNYQNNDARNEGVMRNEVKNNIQEELHTSDTSNDIQETNDNHTHYNGKASVSTKEKVDEQMNKDQKKTKHIQEESVTKIEKGKRDHRKKVTTLIIVIYVLMQAFLPCSHFITKGYNNWTNGLYGYSWDMMVHSWDTNSVVIKIVDNKYNKEFFLDPELCAPNERWTSHGDIAFQYAQCLRNNIVKDAIKHDDISIYFDIWTSLNGRFTQRIFDPKVDILKSSWSIFERVPFLMPLLDDEGLSWRNVLLEIKDEVTSWDNYTEVLFLADFPGYELEKYLARELTNITLTILKGRIVFEPEVVPTLPGYSYILTSGNNVKLDSGRFHRVLTIGDSPAFYMYTFINSTATSLEQKTPRPMLPIFEELSKRFQDMNRFGVVVLKSIYQIIYGCDDC